MTLDVESWVWSVPAMALFLGSAALPICAKADAPPTDRPNRFQALDGLRGFLAFAVFFHHAIVYREFSIYRTWLQQPHSRFYTSLGPVAVASFFMITGFLFWSKLIDEQGKTNWLRLYIGRFFRLYPLFFVTAVITLLSVAIATHFTIRVPASALAVQIIKWLAFGAGQVDVNGFVQTKLLIAGVAWSLHWEVYFYISLPLMAWAAIRKNLYLPFAAVLLCGLLAYAFFFRRSPEEMASVYLAELAAGMTCASLQHKNLGLRLPNVWLSPLLILLFLALFLFPDAHMPGIVLIELALFYLVTSGCSLFGLLTLWPAIRLGNISYGIYLLQGFAFNLLLARPMLRNFGLQSPLQYWLLMLPAGLLLIAFALLAHILVERPGMTAGKKVIASLRKKPATPQPVLS